MVTAELFLLSLGMGIGGFSFLVDSRKTGTGLIKVVSAVCIAALLAAWITHLFFTSHWYGGKTFLYIASLLAHLAVFYWHREDRSFFAWGCFVQCILSSLAILWLSVGDKGILDFLFVASGACLLGCVAYAMLLGHWYLVTPKLSERPLKVLLFVLWGTLLVKLSLEFLVLGSGPVASDLFNKMAWAMRLGWGYFMLGILSYFAYRLVAMRSIQSATGLFYIMVFSSFIGELISIHLFVGGHSWK